MNKSINMDLVSSLFFQLGIESPPLTMCMIKSCFCLNLFISIYSLLGRQIVVSEEAIAWITLLCILTLLQQPKNTPKFCHLWL